MARGSRGDGVWGRRVFVFVVVTGSALQMEGGRRGARSGPVTGGRPGSFSTVSQPVRPVLVRPAVETDYASEAAELLATVERLRAEAAAEQAALVAEREAEKAAKRTDDKALEREKEWTTALRLGHAERAVLEDQVTALHHGIEAAYLEATWAGFKDDGTVDSVRVKGGGADAEASWRLVEGAAAKDGATTRTLELRLSCTVAGGERRRVLMRARALPEAAAKGAAATLDRARQHEAKEADRFREAQAAYDALEGRGGGWWAKLKAYSDLGAIAADHERAAAKAKEIAGNGAVHGDAVRLGSRGAFVVDHKGHFYIETGSESSKGKKSSDSAKKSDGTFASWLIDPAYDPLKQRHR